MSTINYQNSGQWLHMTVISKMRNKWGEPRQGQSSSLPREGAWREGQSPWAEKIESKSRRAPAARVWGAENQRKLQKKSGREPLICLNKYWCSLSDRVKLYAARESTTRKLHK
jgi:hypothetical protein